MLGRASLILRYGKQIVIGACIAFIAGFLVVSYSVESGFNPYPQTTTVSSTVTCASVGGGCPGFEIDGASLSVNNYQDITSQELTLMITPRGSGPMDSVGIILDGVPLGLVRGPFEPGVQSTVSAAVPTTLTLSPGTTHQVVVEGTYIGASGVNATYWDSVSVTAA
jgi:hypothetical protein